MTNEDKVDLHKRLKDIEAQLNKQAGATVANEKLDEEDDDEINKWRKLSSTGFPAYGKDGLMFSKAADGGRADEYKMAKTQKEKAAFRQKWAAARYSTCKLMKQKSKT